MKKFTLNETIFTQLMTMNLEGIELIPAAKRIMPEVLQLAGHGPVTDEFLTGKILEIDGGLNFPNLSPGLPDL